MTVPTLYSLTIFGYKKAELSKKEYHDYISITHAGHLKALLAKNDIVSYTMQHNTPSLTTTLLNKIYPENNNNHPHPHHDPHPHPPQHHQPPTISDCDAVIQIVFRDIDDYVRVRADPHFVSVVGPDHGNFADAEKTRVAVGWFEVHVEGGRVVG